MAFQGVGEKMMEGEGANLEKLTEGGGEESVLVRGNDGVVDGVGVGQNVERLGGVVPSRREVVKGKGKKRGPKPLAESRAEWIMRAREEEAREDAAWKALEATEVRLEAVREAKDQDAAEALLSDPDVVLEAEATAEAEAIPELEVGNRPRGSGGKWMGKQKGERDTHDRPLAKATAAKETNQEVIFNRYNQKAIRTKKRMLRRIVLESDIGLPAVAKKIRKVLQELSILYACVAASGDEFRRNVALAVELSGWRHQGAERAKAEEKRRAEKKAEREEVLERQKMIQAERQFAPLPTEQRF